MVCRRILYGPSHLVFTPLKMTLKLIKTNNLTCTTGKDCNFISYFNYWLCSRCNLVIWPELTNDIDSKRGKL